MNPSPTVIIEQVNTAFGLPTAVFPIAVAVFAVVFGLSHYAFNRKRKSHAKGDSIFLTLLMTILFTMVTLVVSVISVTGESAGNLHAAFQESHNITKITPTGNGELSDLNCWKGSKEPMAVAVTWVNDDTAFHQGVIYRKAASEAGCEYQLLEAE